MATTVTPQPSSGAGTLLLEILQEAAAIVASFFGPGAVAADAAIAAAILRIYQKARAAYEAHVGQPIDEASVQPIDPIP